MRLSFTTFINMAFVQVKFCSGRANTVYCYYTNSTCLFAVWSTSLFKYFSVGLSVEAGDLANNLSHLALSASCMTTEWPFTGKSPTLGPCVAF